jgi:hypothetical protein
MVRAKYSARCSREVGWSGLVANDNGHHREPMFDNGDGHHHLRTGTLQTFMARFHEQEQTLNKLLKHVG